MDFTPHIERAFKRIAEAAFWTPQGGAEIEILADFRNAYIEAVTGVVGTQPLAYVLKSQVPGIQVADTLKIRGNTYQVRNVQQDSTPACLLLPLSGPTPPAGGDFLLESGDGAIDLESGDKLKQESPDTATVDGVGLEDGSGSILLEDGGKLKDE
jgi:hypothetical protein